MKNKNNSNYTDTTLAQQFKNVFVGHLRSLVIVFIIFLKLDNRILCYDILGYPLQLYYITVMTKLQ